MTRGHRKPESLRGPKYIDTRVDEVYTARKFGDKWRVASEKEKAKVVDVLYSILHSAYDIKILFPFSPDCLNLAIFIEFCVNCSSSNFLLQDSVLSIEKTDRYNQHPTTIKSCGDAKSLISRYTVKIMHVSGHVAYSHHSPGPLIFDAVMMLEILVHLEVLSWLERVSMIRLLIILRNVAGVHSSQLSSFLWVMKWSKALRTLTW